jgi:hypothetical protein
MSKRYCQVCGKRSKIIDAGYYDEETGRRVLEFERCGTKDCAHGYHKYGFFFWQPCRICGNYRPGELP